MTNRIKTQILNRCRCGECISFEELPDELRDDKDVALAVVANDWMSFQDFSERLRNDPDVARIALSVPLDGGEASDADYPIYYTGDPIRSNKELMKLAVSANACAFQYASKEIQSDIEVIDAFESSYDAYYDYWETPIRYADKQLLDDETFIRKRLVPGFAFASTRIRKDFHIAAEAITGSVTMIKFADPTLLSNEAFMDIAVSVSEDQFACTLDRRLYLYEVERHLQRGTLEKQYRDCLYDAEDIPYGLWGVPSPLLEEEAFIEKHSDCLGFMTMCDFSEKENMNPKLKRKIERRKQELLEIMLVRLKYEKES